MVQQKIDPVEIMNLEASRITFKIWDKYNYCDFLLLFQDGSVVNFDTTNPENPESFDSIIEFQDLYGILSSFTEDHNLTEKIKTIYPNLSKAMVADL